MLGESLCIYRFYTKLILPFIRKYNLKCRACHVIHTRDVVLSEIENVFLPNLNRLNLKKKFSNDFHHFSFISVTTLANRKQIPTHTVINICR